MAVSLVSALPTIHPVYDPLIVALQDAGDPASARTGQSQVEVQLEIEDVLNSDSWRLIGEYLNPYNYDTDEAQVNLNQALIGAFDADPSEVLSNSLVSIPGIIKRYRLKARDVVDGEPEGSFATLGPGYAWNAGNRYTKIGTDPINGSAYRFLTVRPYNRRIHPNESLSVQFATFTDSADVDLIADVHYNDGTEEELTFSLGALDAWKVYAIELPAPGSGYSKQVKSIACHLDGFIGGGEFRRWWTIPKPSPYYQRLLMRNSLGGWESIALTGKCEEINQPISELFEAQEYPPTNAQRGNSRAFNQRAVDSLVLRTGYMSEDELRSLRDLTLRNEVYIQEGNALRKLILNNSQWRVKTDGDFLHALEVTARYAWEEKAYSRS